MLLQTVHNAMDKPYWWYTTFLITLNDVLLLFFKCFLNYSVNRSCLIHQYGSSYGNLQRCDIAQMCGNVS